MGISAGEEEEVSSRTEGSAGGGPSKAHRRDSYLERMKDSILLLKQIVLVYKTNVIETTH